MSANRISAVLLTGALLAGIVCCTAPAGAQTVTCPGADTPAASTTPDALSETVRCLLNVERAKAGLGPLSRQRKLLRAAHRLGADMVRNRFLSHIGSDGSTPLSRVRKTGFLKGSTFFKVGEILAWGEGPATSPSVIVNAWMGRPVHRGNILDKKFNRVGVGVEPGEPVGSPNSPTNQDAATYTVDLGVVRH